jgi:hypothetical protein
MHEPHRGPAPGSSSRDLDDSEARAALPRIPSPSPPDVYIYIYMYINIYMYIYISDNHGFGPTSGQKHARQLVALEFQPPLKCSPWTGRGRRCSLGGQKRREGLQKEACNRSGCNEQKTPA